MITVKQFICNPFGENTYLIYDETKEAAIIDCGCINPTEEAKISDAISANKLTLKKLLTTHYHFDHIVGNAFIYHAYGIYPEMSEDELNNDTPTLNQQASAFGIPTKFEDIKPEKYLKENDEIKFGNSTLVALNVAGHSPSSLAYYSKEDSIVFVGDAIFCGSIGRTDLWGGNNETLITNIKKNLFTLPDNTIIYPGHGTNTTIGYEKANNPYFLM